MHISFFVFRVNGSDIKIPIISCNGPTSPVNYSFVIYISNINWNVCLSWRNYFRQINPFCSGIFKGQANFVNKKWNIFDNKSYWSEMSTDFIMALMLVIPSSFIWRLLFIGIAVTSVTLFSTMSGDLTEYEQITHKMATNWPCSHNWKRNVL
jgi:hypothetical protein